MGQSGCHGSVIVPWIIQILNLTEPFALQALREFAVLKEWGVTGTDRWPLRPSATSAEHSSTSGPSPLSTGSNPRS